MSSQQLPLEYSVPALGMLFSIVKDIYAEADVLVRETLTPEDVSAWDAEEIPTEVNAAFTQVAEATKKLLPIWNDLESEFRTAVMQEYVDTVQPNLDLVASRCAGIAMAAVNEEELTAEQRGRARDILQQIGYFNPKGNHPYFS